MRADGFEAWVYLAFFEEKQEDQCGWEEEDNRRRDQKGI